MVVVVVRDGRMERMGGSEPGQLGTGGQDWTGGLDSEIQPTSWFWFKFHLETSSKRSS